RRRRGRRQGSQVRARRAAERDQRHQQLAPAPDGGPRAAATHLIYRGRAAVGVQVHSPRDRREPGRARRELAEDDAEQVLPPGHRVARRARQRLPDRGARAVPLRRHHDRQLRGRRADAAPARHDSRVREPAWRHAVDARRPARSHRRRLGTDERRRSIARAAARARRPELRARAGEGHARAARPDLGDDAPRGRRRGQQSRVGRVARSRRLPDGRRAEARCRNAARSAVHGQHRAAARASALRPRQRLRSRDGRHLALADAAAARRPAPRDVLAPVPASGGHDGAAARDVDVRPRVLRRREHGRPARRGPRQVLQARVGRRRVSRSQRRDGPADDGPDDARGRRARPLRGGLRHGAYGRLPVPGHRKDRRRRARPRAIRRAARGRRHRALSRAAEPGAARAALGRDRRHVLRCRRREQTAGSRELFGGRQCRTPGARSVEHTAGVHVVAAPEVRRVAAASLLGPAVRARLPAVLLVALGAAAPAHAEIYYLIVGGLGGESAYEAQFAKDTDALAAVARRTTAQSRVMVLKGEAATHEAVVNSFESLRTRTKAADSVVVMLVGHGSYDGELYKLNLPGPDIDGDEMAKLLAAVPARSQLVVNATSASGSILEKWKADGRTLITATRSGFERNATRFAQHFAAALAAGSADINKSGAITAQEAFDYASRSVADSFEKDGTLATEHPQIAGGAATRFTVARLASAGPAEPVSTDPAVATLVAEREKLDGDIEALRGRRESMASDAYLAELQRLLVQLAEVQSKIDAAQPRPAQ